VESFWLCFVPVFVAVDPVGLLPIYLAITEGLSFRQRHRIIRQSVVTAVVVAVGFLFLGQWVLAFLDISVADFMIAGGLLLLAFAMIDLLSVEKRRRQVDPETVGAVPLGVPLMVGPAVLTVILLLANQHGWLPTALAVMANLLIAGGLFWFSQGIHRALGLTGVRTVSKVVGVILAAFGVMMVRKGILAIIAGFPSAAG
jgi:multiple antibiotic resistance protein